MPDARLLGLTVQRFTKEQLAIDVTNTSGVALDKPFLVEITFPKNLLKAEICEAAEGADKKTPPIANVDKYVKGTEGKFSVWAEPETTKNFVTLMFVNDLDYINDETVEISPRPLAAGAGFTILVPLDPETPHTSGELLYGYEYDKKSRVDGKLELQGEEIDWTPEVSFTTDQRTPTAITPMADVKIEWEIKDGVWATLRGPLPGGNTEWSLSDSATSSFKMSKGSFVIKAVSSMTFMLQAEVKGPPPQSQRVRVSRMLSLDINTREKHGYIDARPSRVLPYGLVEIDWAAWGVKAVNVTAPGVFRNIQLTDMTLSGFPQGRGVVRTNAPKTNSEASFKAELSVLIEGKMQSARKVDFTVVPWTKMEAKPKFTGNPLGLAVAGSMMALLTTDGLWTAKVGEVDDQHGIHDLDFTQADTDKPKAWLAIATLGDKFVVLRQTDENDLQVAFYKSNGTRDEIDSLDLKALMGSGPVFDFAVFHNRAYVVVESSSPTGRVRSAFSVGVVTSPTKKAESRNELLLECLSGCRLLTFDNALFALTRDSGQMLRLELNVDRLEPYKAASAVDKGASLVKQGLLVPFGRVMAVFNPTAVPSLASLAGFGLRNVLPSRNLAPLQDASGIPQDLVYDAQHNRWVRCGRGADTKVGVVAFREGDSPRLWVIDNNCEAHTLTGSTEELFLPDYESDRPSDALPTLLNKKRAIKIINNTDMRFVPLNDTYFKLFLTAFSATRPVDMIPPKINLMSRREETFELRYNETDPGTTTLRFLVHRPDGIKNEYFLELTISGAALSNATSVFKRIATDGTITELPETRQQHSTANRIEINGKPIRFTLTNTTPYKLWLRRSGGEREYINESEININIGAAPFSIYAHGAGELFFNFDFGLPHGFEAFSPNEPQKTRIGFDTSKSQGLSLLTPGFGGGGANYSSRVNYKIEKDLKSGVYMGDGAPSKDGEHFYLPLSDSPGQFKLIKFRATDLDVSAQSITLNGDGIFSVPNSVAVLSNEVLTIDKNNTIKRFTPELKPVSEVTPGYDLVTNFQGSPHDDKYFMVWMQQVPNASSYTYHYIFYTGSFKPNDNWQEMFLDDLKGFRPQRVRGAPAWVSPNTISLMSGSGGRVAICVEGGLFLIQLQGETVTEIPIDGSGRQEAIVIDPKQPVIYCVHSQQNGSKLIISRVEGPNTKQSITLPSGVIDMVTNTNPPGGTNLRYNCPRAISLAVSDNALYLSNGKTIWAFDKVTLNQKRTTSVDLPCRLIHVRPGTPPGGNHPNYGAPRDCEFLWAIGASYEGDGQSRNKYQTKLYKIAIVL